MRTFCAQAAGERDSGIGNYRAETSRAAPDISVPAADSLTADDHSSRPVEIPSFDHIPMAIFRAISADDRSRRLVEMPVSDHIPMEISRADSATDHREAAALLGMELSVDSDAGTNHCR